MAKQAHPRSGLQPLPPQGGATAGPAKPVPGWHWNGSPMHFLRKFAFPLFALVMLALPALPVPDFWITQSNYIGLYALVALGLVLLTGVAGLTSFGQAAFVGVGAYSAAFLAVKLAASPWLALLVGVGLAVVAALALGAITLRMSGHYLPLATIAWGLALNYSMANMDWLGKYDGILGVPRSRCSAWTSAPAAGCMC